MPHRPLFAPAAGLALALASPLAQSVPFTFGDSIKGSFDSTIAAGLGLRIQSPACDLLTEGGTRSGPPAACLSPTAGVGDQGNLNYDRGDLFTSYLKGTHELVLKMPAGVTAMARGTWIRDFAATHTTGLQSFNAPADLTDGQTPEARKDLRFKARLLDLWVSKSFAVGDQQVRVRAGNQVVNWGESLYFGGGINATNALDYQRLASPGTQIKEGLLPAPMVSVASGLGGGVNVEGYWQFGWNDSYLPPAGSYWSTTEGLGKGSTRYGANYKDASNSGQWGLSLRWQPGNSSVNLGAYVLNYHDKLPVLTVNLASFTPDWSYLENRKLYGLSINLPAGDWALGGELSYRPKDAVSLNSAVGCFARDGRCWVDNKRLQANLTALYSLTPGNFGNGLKFVGADTGSLLLEYAVIHYPGLRDSYDGDFLAAGYGGWGQEFDPTAAPTQGGTRTSSALALQFSLTYDNSLIEGWQVTPSIYFQRALSGRTPNLVAQFMRGAQTLNFAVDFIRNPASWQFTANYSRFSGGKSPLDNALRDRDFVGLVLSRTF